jgi:hypothetical protein
MPPDPSAPAVITVTERQLAEVRSTGADVFVSISERRAGAATSGRIVELRRALQKRGVTDADVMLEGIEKSSWAWIPIPFAIACGFAALFSDDLRSHALKAAAGLVILSLLLAFARLGSMSARLKVRGANAERVNAILDTLFAFSGADIQSIAWRYETDAEAREAWTAEAVARARRRAERIATELGVQIIGVQALHEDCEPPPRGEGAPPPIPVARKQRSAGVAESIGPAPSNTTQVLLTVSIQYCVAPVQKG